METNNTEKEILKQIEELLSIKITPIHHYVTNPNTMKSTPVFKDLEELNKEQGEIISLINDMFYEAEIDLKTRRDMILVILKEYDKMKKAVVNNKSNNEESEERIEKFEGKVKESMIVGNGSKTSKGKNETNKKFKPYTKKNNIDNEWFFERNPELVNVEDEEDFLTEDGQLDVYEIIRRNIEEREEELRRLDRERIEREETERAEGHRRMM